MFTKLHLQDPQGPIDRTRPNTNTHSGLQFRFPKKSHQPRFKSLYFIPFYISHGGTKKPCKLRTQNLLWSDRANHGTTMPCFTIFYIICTRNWLLHLIFQVNYYYFLFQTMYQTFSFRPSYYCYLCYYGELKRCAVASYIRFFFLLH